MAYLRQLSDDDSLSFKFSSTGSVIFHLIAEKQSYRNLRRMFLTKQLVFIVGYEVLDIFEDQIYPFWTRFKDEIINITQTSSQNDIFTERLKNSSSFNLSREKAHGYFTFIKLEGDISNRMKFRGKEMIVWSLSNYLGLANDWGVKRTDRIVAEEYGFSTPMGSRLMVGNTNSHEQLEQKLALFEQKEDALLLNYGYQGMVSIIDTLCSRHDVIVYDAESHACIIDGVRLHSGHRYVFKHNDIADLTKQLSRAAELIRKQNNGGILVITEGVFGLAGDQGRIAEISQLKKSYNFRLLVNDSHGFGTLGAAGIGVGGEQNCQHGIDLYFASFSKSMASIGAFVAGDKNIIDYLRYNIRSQIFAKSLPLSIVISNLKRLQLLKDNEALRIKLWYNASKLQNGLRIMGFDIGITNTVITPVYINGSIAEATAMVMDLRENYHILCSIVVYPVIPKGKIIFRLIPTAVHTNEDIELTLAAFSKTKRKLDAGEYKLAGENDLVEYEN